MKPLVSVIMPCYNDGKYITEAVNSIIKQTYTNWELIIIDDGSDDICTIRILNKLKRDNIIILRREHEGVVKARNTAISNSKGKYIIPMDADDIAEPQLLEKYVEIAEMNPNIGIVYCIYEYFEMRQGIYNLPKYSIPNMLVSNCINNTSLFRREDWERVDGYNSNMEMGCEDYDFWLSILELGRKVQLVPEVLLHYRVKSRAGRTTAIDIKREYAISNQIFENHKALYKENWDSVMKVEREKIIALQEQINCLYNEKYKWRMRLYRIPLLYKVLHKIFR